MLDHSTLVLHGKVNKMIQQSLFDIIQPEEPKRFVAKLFRVECFWHCKVIKGIDIKDSDEILRYSKFRR